MVVLISRFLSRSCLSSRKRKLREIYKHTAHCSATLNAGYLPKIDDLLYTDPDDAERRFLDENDLSK